MKKISTLLLLLPSFIIAQNYTQYVNPFIGTKKMGHTFPGATVPFGMVQLSPTTGYINFFTPNKQYNSKVYEYCSGYQYDDSLIYGFAHTHFSGTGHSDLGDFLVMPFMGKPNLNHAMQPAVYSSFNHSNEQAKPGYYAVHLNNSNIQAQLTSTDRVGFHQYTFNTDGEASIMFDFVYNIYNYEGKNVWTFIRIENDSTITGYRQTKGWGRTRTMYFAAVLSKKIKNYYNKKFDATSYNGFYRKFNETENFAEIAGENIKLFLNFDVKNKEQIKLKFALSPVSTAGALLNLQKEIPHFNFEQTAQEADKKWNKELAKIDIATETPEQKNVFYTALYHSFLSPTIYQDVDGQYKGLDQNIYKNSNSINYSTFSLWDTYRALHPLFNLLQPARNNDMIKSMLAHQQQSVHKMLPVWSHHANENWCMIGYHATSVIADALVKKTTNIDVNKALQACVSTANVNYFDGIEWYKKLGYVPEDKSGESVSKTLEYAYDDWCIAQIAKLANNKNSYNTFINRSNYFKNVYDSVSGFMRPKLSNGLFKNNFDPLDTHGQGFIEGNALNYGLYVPQQIDTMIKMMGGNKKFEQLLDTIFTTHLDNKYIEKNEDITRDGLIGAYVHGNEPGHHIAYLYNFAGAPHKTQYWVKYINNTMYANASNGLCGNDDAGQMSAWYIFSALGFYPVTPGSNYYSLGCPTVTKATVYLANHKALVINTINQSKNKYKIKSISFNKKRINNYMIDYNQIINGGTLTFEFE